MKIYGMRDHFIILIRAGIKVIRGMLRKPFFGSSAGLLLVGSHVSISHGHHVRCGRRVKFEDYSEIHGLCRHGIFLGDDVTIGRGTMIRPSSYYGGDCGYGLVIGDNSSIGPYGYVGCSGKIIIGSNVMIGPKCSLFAENHNFKRVDKIIKNQGVNSKGIIIEDDCWIGSNVIILDGVTVGRGSVIGAGTVLTKDVPAFSVVIDKKIKVVRRRDSTSNES